MNQIINQLKNRKSVRSFTYKEISYEDTQLILNSATQAPTAGNQQLYTIINVTDSGLKERLSVLCDNQPFIKTAKLVLVFCADCKKWYDAFLFADAQPRKPGVGDLMLAVTDTAIAAQNAVTAAESLGIGSCYIGDIMEGYENIKSLLSLPEYVFPACMLVFGYPTQQQTERLKPKRADLKHIVHQNSYRNMDEKELREMLRYKAGKTNYPEWIKAFCERKYNSEFSKEMTRSVAEYLKEFEG